MGLFRRTKQTPTAEAVPEAVPEERAANLAQAWAQVMAGSSYATGSGVSVTAESAMRNAAVWACVRQLTSTITGLPIDVIRSQGGRRRTLATAEQPGIIRRPDPRISRRAWTGQVVRSLLTDGNAYGDILGIDPLTGRPTEIAMLAPAAVNWIGGTPYVNGVARKPGAGGDLWHLPVSFLLQPGASTAMSPVRYAAESIGTGLAAERFGGDFFGQNGGKPLAEIILKGAKPSDEQLQSAHDNFMAATQSRRPFVHGDGTELKDGPKVDPSDTQFIDLMRFEVEQACRWFGMPPSLVFAAVSGQNVTYANVTQSDLHYLKHTVAGWLMDLEEALTDFVAGPLSVKYNVDAVLRMDAEARTKIHVQRLQSKTRTVNEVRAMEDEEPFDDPAYDLPGIPGDPAMNIVGVPDVTAPAA